MLNISSNLLFIVVASAFNIFKSAFIVTISSSILSNTDLILFILLVFLFTWFVNIVILLLWFYGLAYVFVLGLYLNKYNTESNIEKTNTIKLEEIRKKVKDTKNNKK